VGDDGIFDRGDQILAFPPRGIGKRAAQFQMLCRLRLLPVVKQGGAEEHAKLGVFPIVLQIMKNPLRKVEKIV